MVYLVYTSRSSLSKGKSGPGTGEEHYLIAFCLAYSPSGLYSTGFSFTAQNNQPRDGATHIGLGPSISMDNKKIPP